MINHTSFTINDNHSACLRNISRKNIFRMPRQTKKTNTLLGFVDIPIDGEEKPTIEDTFIGGEPLWFDPASPPTKKLLLCKNCEAPMKLLLQSYCPLANSIYDRIIYVFTCTKAQCRRKAGSVRAIRAVRRDPEAMKKKEVEIKTEEYDRKQAEEKAKQEKMKTKELAKNIFTSGSKGNSFNPFDSNPFSAPEQKSANPFDALEKNEDEGSESEDKSVEIKAEDYKSLIPRKSTLQKPNGKLDISLASFPGFFLYVEDEILDPSKSLETQLPPGITPSQLSQQGNSASSGKDIGQSKELEEISKAVDDPTFRHFTEIVSYNPSQVFRYEFGGSPLLYNTKDAISKVFCDSKGHLLDCSHFRIPNAAYHPSGSRVLELQIMPQAIDALESDGSIDILKDGMEWGTILVGSDAEDYTPESFFDENYIAYVEEWCGVQWEEEVKN